MFNKNLKNPPKKYRPAPFWSWNEKLEEAETADVVEIPAQEQKEDIPA